jgi:hypothetical protein
LTFVAIEELFGELSMKVVASGVAVAIGIGFALLGAGCSSSENGAPSGSAAGMPGSSGAAVVGGSSGAGGGSSGATAAGAGGMIGSGGVTAGSGGSGTGGGGGAAGSAGANGSAGSGGGVGQPSTEKFSFFVTSMASLLELAKAYDASLDVGFGGDFSYGEAGPGAGLRGADKICSAIAEKSMPGHNKRWRAFLSVTQGEDGMPVNAIDRVGDGPWYDRIGRTVAMNKAGLATTRPTGGDATIADDLPNEFGVPNNRPDPNEDEVDNHDTLTGSNAQGELDSQDMSDTCNDWTSKVGELGPPRIGHSWPRQASQSWISVHAAGGCAPGVNIFGSGGPQPGDYTVGAGGGYGGIYCFSLDP